MSCIRRANETDKDVVEKLYIAVTGKEFAVADGEWKRWVDSGGLVIAEVDNQTIGFGGIDVTAREQLRWLYVLPEYHRAGFGSRILRELEEIAWRSGLRSIRLHSTPAAVQFYNKFGYTQVLSQEQFGHEHDGVEMFKARPDIVS